VDAASKDFVLVELDMPNSDKEMTARNLIYVEKYKVEGFPTVILLNSDGKEFTRFFAADYVKVDDFLAHLKTSLQKRELD